MLCTTVTLGPDSAAVAFTDKVVDIPVRGQSSMTILRRNGCFFGAFCAIFRTPPKGVESRGARIFRALDDEEFFVVEGSLGWRGRRESDSQVTCQM